MALPLQNIGDATQFTSRVKGVCAGSELKNKLTPVAVAAIKRRLSLDTF